MKIYILTLMMVGVFSSISKAGETPSQVAQQIDQQLEQAWKQQEIKPAETVDDLGFLRRVTLDLTGRLPTPDEIDAFSKNNASNKREGAVKRLLNSEAYASHWAEYWFNILMGRLTREAFIDRYSFRDWLKEEFAANRPWSTIATELVSAEGYNSHRRPKGAKSDPPQWDERFNPATNWFLRYFRSLPDYSGAVAKNLLGLQIQCAQCHDHPTEHWKQKDFEQFTALFATTWPTYFDRTFVVGTLRMETKERRITPPTMGRFGAYFSSYVPYVKHNPKILGEAELGRFEPRRASFADWMTQKDNPWFGRAFVNRMWKKLLGTGFVEPVDDFRPSNPAVMPEILNLLTQDFIENDYDIRRLLTIICLTDAYQRQCKSPETKAGAHSLWSAYPLKPLEIETFYDVVLQATKGSKYLKLISKNNPDLLRDAFIRQFVADVGTDEMTESENFGETVPRALMQLNGALTTGLTRKVRGLALAEALQLSQPQERIRFLYRQTLSRDPSDQEMQTWTAFLAHRNRTAESKGPPSRIPKGLQARRISQELLKADPDTELRELLKEAKTGADFKMLAGRMKNNADAGLFVKAFEAWVAEAPFNYLIELSGAKTPEEQAYEDLFWVLVSCSEFLTNH